MLVSNGKLLLLRSIVCGQVVHESPPVSRSIRDTRLEHPAVVSEDFSFNSSFVLLLAFNLLQP